MRSTDRSCKTSRLTAKEFADAISNHYQTQTISDRQWRLGLDGRSWFASHTGSVTVRHNRHPGVTSSYVTPGAVHHLNFSPFAANRRLPVAVCLCEERAELSVVTSGTLCRLYMSAYTQVSRSPVYCTYSYFPCNAQFTQRLCQYSRPRHDLLSCCYRQPGHENGRKSDSCQV